MSHHAGRQGGSHSGLDTIHHNLQQSQQPTSQGYISQPTGVTSLSYKLTKTSPGTPLPPLKNQHSTYWHLNALHNTTLETQWPWVVCPLPRQHDNTCFAPHHLFLHPTSAPATPLLHLTVPREYTLNPRNNAYGKRKEGGSLNSGGDGITGTH